MQFRGFYLTFAFGFALFFGVGPAFGNMASGNTIVQAPESFSDALETALVAEGAPDRLAITLAGSAHAGAEPAVLVTSYDVETGRFTAEFTSADGSRRLVHGKAEAIVSVPVLVRDMRPGDIIRAADISFRDMPRGRVQRAFITDDAALVGMATRRSMREGDTIRNGDVERPLVVKKGDLVTIIFEAPGISLTARGRAMASGSLGDVIQVVNVQSHRTIDASVTGTGRVAVSTLGDSAPVVLSANTLSANTQ